MNDSVSEWLDECRTQATKRSYGNNIRAFRDWYKKPLTEFLKLEPKQMRHAAIMFQNEAQNGWKTRYGTALKPNSIITTLNVLAAYCTFNDKPLRLKGKKLKPTMDLTSHAFADADLTKMFNVGNTQEKAILAAFCSLGWEVSGLLALEREYVQSLIQRAKEQDRQFIYFIDQRKKTGAIRLGILNPLAIEWIGEWLKVPVERIQQGKGPVPFDAKRLFSYNTTEGVNKMMKRLAREAHVTVTGRVHTHQVRKWVMSGLSRAGFNEFQIKFVMGKAIPISDMTYLLTLQREVEERYPEAYADYLDISGKRVGAPISDEDVEVWQYLARKYREGKIRIEP